MNDLIPPLPQATSPIRQGKPAKGFFPPEIVRAISFYIISICIFASVIVCILAIWDFAKKDSLWRLVASFLVVAGGTALFALVNGTLAKTENLSTRHGYDRGASASATLITTIKSWGF